MESTVVKYGITRSLKGESFEAVREKIGELLAKEGFGILTEIDVAATLKKKLDVDFRRYIILGACNPSLAYQGLQMEPQLGLLLPCNVIVSEEDDGSVTVAAMDPYGMVKVSENFDLEEIAIDAREKLKRAIGAL